MSRQIEFYDAFPPMQMQAERKQNFENRLRSTGANQLQAGDTRPREVR